MSMTPGEFMRTYEAATCAHDLEATVGMIAADAIYLFSNGTSHVGKDAIRRVLQANFDLIKAETYAIRGLRWLAGSDDVAACVYGFAWSGEIDGKPAAGKGRGTTVIRRIGGQWKVAHEHLSAGPLWHERPPHEVNRENGSHDRQD
jgi:ketosteroid isomerase-like protein